MKQDTLILMEEPNRGQTLIEKFEQGSLKVSFAVILLTPDDHGWSVTDSRRPNKPNRARQNVILELGYFMGSLGRNRIAALYRGPLDLPSDTYGIGYIPMDSSDGWKLKLAQELDAAGLPIDRAGLLGVAEAFLET